MKILAISFIILANLIPFGSGRSKVLSREELHEHKLVINRRYGTNDVAKEEIKSGENVEYTCEYYMKVNDQERLLPKLQWYFEGNPVMTSRNSKSDVSSRLILRNLKDDHAGLYECHARFDNQSNNPTLIRRIRLAILKTPHWIDDKTTVGGVVGSPLTVNCESTANDPSSVEIIVTPPEPNVPQEQLKRFKAKGDKVYIKKLRLKDNNFKVSCTVSQIYEDMDEIPTIEKTVTIEVYFPPVFQNGTSVVRYGIIDQNLTIPCIVIDSNPAVDNMVFFVNGTPMSPELYPTKLDLNDGSAYLDILKLNNDYFGSDFQCKAMNSKDLSSIQTIQLQKTDQPSYPLIAYMGADDDSSIKWKLTDDIRNPNVRPILRYNVKYMQADELGSDVMNSENPAWQKSRLENVDKKDLKMNNLYVLTNLRPKTKYAFRFQSLNDAGYSNWSDVHIAVVKKSHVASGVSKSWYSFTAGCLMWRFIIQILILIFAYK